MKIRIESDRIRLQSETESESQLVNDILVKLWSRYTLGRIPDEIMNDHGHIMRKGEARNYLTLPLPEA